MDQREARLDGPERVVVVGARRAEDGHRRVADELLELAPVPADGLADGREVRVLDGGQVLRIQALGQRREPDQVGEQDARRSAARTGSRENPRAPADCIRAAGDAAGSPAPVDGQDRGRR